ncbi:pilus assembly protein TadG-related protein [Streptomyces sp. NPDC058459]|uniref:pilus assembly protein TadG-related protein n=1 Tax=Streptomyces sp. NPDC058459 TaxID=3346508 RepID=UPI00364C1F7A
MTGSGSRQDTGQAFPIYITVVAGLLFLALAYLAVGQAAVNRGGAQTAADAAALAAAQDRRDQLAGKWVDDLLDPTKWQAIFDGDVRLPPSCWRAEELAAQNDADAQCSPQGPLAFTVRAETHKSVGDSVVPGSENFHSKASAKAVIKSICTFAEPGEGAGGDVLPRLVCENGRDWDLKPDDLTQLPEPQDLFDVHLAAD